MTKFAIISNNQVISETLAKKIVLLRSKDICLQFSADETTKAKELAHIYIIYEPAITHETCKNIKNLKDENNIVILMCDSFEQETLLSAYDAGIDDFCNTNIPNYELSIKIINAQKILNKNNLINRYKKQLSDKNVFENTNGIYKTITEGISQLYTQKITALSIKINDEKIFNKDLSEEFFTKNIRSSDRVINYDTYKYLFILPNTSLAQTAHLYGRIKDFLKINLCGCIFKVSHKSESDILNKINKLETDQICEKAELYTELNCENYTSEDWLDTDFSDEKPKNYKLFKTLYNAKTEKVITPVFYRIKQKYENNFTNTIIKYFTDKNSAELFFVNLDNVYRLKVLFKNSPKVDIIEEYSGLENPVTFI